MSQKESKLRNSRPRVYVVGGGFEYIRLMYRLGCDGATGLDDADLVLFTGGEDVDPSLYGEPHLKRTRSNLSRDTKETAIYRGALDRGLPMVGICRGGQFLNVMNGGKLWQHVTNHTAQHLAYVQIPPFQKGKKPRVISVTSTHHQMMIPGPDACVLLTARNSYERNSVGVTTIGLPDDDDPDIEAVFYDKTDCLCFQPHPEFPNAPADCVNFFDECLRDFIFPRVPLNELGKSIISQIPTAINGSKEK
jgi:gamma-glutamyl-gamma-aminobutyrate hydrolase PuuD